MTVIELPDDQADALRAQATAAGLTLETWLTFDQSGFSRYRGIEAVHPATVTARPTS